VVLKSVNDGKIQLIPLKFLDHNIPEFSILMHDGLPYEIIEVLISAFSVKVIVIEDLLR